jgi:hypothetical protein
MPHPLTALHRAVGNQAVQRLMPSGPLATEANERAANLSADRFVRAMRPLGAGERSQAVSTVVAANRLNIHEGESAAEVTSAAHAHGVTAGRDVYFQGNSFNPRTDQGLWLMGHEFAHARQQAEAGSCSVQHYGDPIPTTVTPTVKTMQEFIDLVAKVEAANPGMGALEISQTIMRTKYKGDAWNYLLPSSAGKAGVSAGGKVTADDAATLGEDIEVTVPGGGSEDPSHLVAAVTANAETQAPGAGGAGGWKGKLVGALPSGLKQRDVATWTGDVASAAANWHTVTPLPSGGKGNAKQDYMTEYSPESDMMGDVDGVALGSTKTANGFVFDATKPLSDNLRRFFLPGKAREGRFRRFHTFCDVEGMALKSDGMTLDSTAETTIDDKVQKNTDWFEKNDPTILKWMMVQSSGGYNPIVSEWITRANDWKWFSQQFKAFVQKNLSAEGK